MKDWYTCGDHTMADCGKCPHERQSLCETLARHAFDDAQGTLFDFPISTRKDENFAYFTEPIGRFIAWEDMHAVGITL